MLSSARAPASSGARVVDGADAWGGRGVTGAAVPALVTLRGRGSSTWAGLLRVRCAGGRPTMGCGALVDGGRALVDG
ncbi:hypothetical protein K7472_22340 [Streptomyces sp. PTM05]|uniref:Uncharacterized protein n=1 Tax=Streptantibioticus parmotrematis TaxID=2873249 RepID=A0ABS7QWH4_9ACTN|nr:hypothetical protein [Streptantibioticus parmotrematis]MBY8887557.1 hypothetical protein [Streptantibioticus parmotrematis]